MNNLFITYTWEAHAVRPGENEKSPIFSIFVKSFVFNLERMLAHESSAARVAARN